MVLNVPPATKDLTFSITNVLNLALRDHMKSREDVAIAFLHVPAVKIVLQMVAPDACKDITYKMMGNVFGETPIVLKKNLSTEFL